MNAATEKFVAAGGPLEEIGTITNLVNRLSAGELLSRDDLFPVVYAELRTMAQYRLKNEPRGVPATDLVPLVYV